MQAVAGLVKDDRAWVIQQGLADFFAPMGGQAVHEQGAGVRQIEQRLVDLIGLKNRPAVAFFAFMTHGRPHIGDHQVRAFHRFPGSSTRSTFLPLARMSASG